MTTPRPTTTSTTSTMTPARPMRQPRQISMAVLARLRAVIGTAGLARSDATVARLVLRHLLFDGQPVPEWRRDAACAEVGAEVFYPEPGDELGTAAGKRICTGCPVRTDCLTDALAWETASTRHGIAGGLTAAERGSLTRQYRAASTADIEPAPSAGAAA